MSKRTSDAPPEEPSPKQDEDRPKVARRTLLERTATVAMAGGLLAGYGSCAAVAGRYVYPTDEKRVRLFVTELAAMAVGESLTYTTPSGMTLSITRRGEGATADDFIALSSTCPHLGCRVFWEADKKRFFCPCHNGTFDPVGNPTGGPPKADDTPLIRYPLAVEHGLLYVDLPERELS